MAEGGGMWRRLVGARGGIIAVVEVEVEVAEAGGGGDDERDAAIARATVSSERGSDADFCRLMLSVTVAPGWREAAAGGDKGGICFFGRQEWGGRVIEDEGKQRDARRRNKAECDCRQVPFLRASARAKYVVVSN